MTEDKPASIVLITSAAPEGNSSFGTGFVVHRENSISYIVTCAHVVRDVGGGNNILVEKQFNAELVTPAEDIVVDLAILKVDGLETSPLPLGDFGDEGTKAQIRGYSSLQKDEFVYRELQCILDKEAGVFSQQHISAWDIEIIDKASLKEGYSGSPVLDQDRGMVIAVTSYGQHDGRKGLAISIAELGKVWPDMPPHLLLQSRKLGEGRSSNIPFTNREEELKRLAYSEEERLTLYFVVDAPAGYGKSTLLKEVKKRYEAKKWAYALVQMKGDSELKDLAHDLCRNIEVEGQKLAIKMTNSSRWGERVAGGIVSEFRNKLPEGRGLVILIDLDGKPNEDLTNQLFLEFIPDLQRVLDRLEARKPQRLLKLYVIIAGRYLSQISNENKYEETIPLSYVPLSSFKFKHIYDSAREYFEGIGDEEKRLISGLALCLGAGHPGCMSHIFHHAEKCQLPANDCLERHGQDIWNKFVSECARNVCNQMDLIMKNDVYYRLSMFRYIDDQLLDTIARKYSGGAFEDGFKLSDTLTTTYLFQKKRDLVQDSIVRRLIALQLYNSQPRKFRKFCKEAQQMCIANLSSSLTDMNLWAIEYLFQCLQENLGKCLIKPSSRRKLYKQFMEKRVPQIISELKRVYEKQDEGHIYKRSKKETLLRMIQEDDQWELKFAVNYHLRQDSFNGEPFQELVRKIETLL